MDTLLTLGLIGAFMAATVAIHVTLTAQPPEPVPARSTDDLDAELFRIIDDARLRGF
jgi:hypothetical protein